MYTLGEEICIRKHDLQLDTGVDARDAVPEVGPGAALALAHGASREARVLDHLRECRLRRELADALDEVLVRRAVAGEDRAEQRDDRERILVVDPVVSHRTIQVQRVLCGRKEGSTYVRKRGLLTWLNSRQAKVPPGLRTR